MWWYKDMAARFPEWIRRNWASGKDFADTHAVVDSLKLRTVCQSARCPNLGECWARRTATFMVLGNVCTRRCAFCAVSGGIPESVDPTEPGRVAQAIQQLGLRYAVVTSVTRDDLSGKSLSGFDDGGAAHFARTVEAIRAASPGTVIEVLVPDFGGKPEAIGRVLESAPDVFGHNIETVERLYPALRDPRYRYRRSLEVLAMAAELAPEMAVKSALMVGHGETAEEVRATLRDLRDAGCDVVSLGQYLRPSRAQVDVKEFVPPERFRAYEALAYQLGFSAAMAGPFVRSSYRSEELWAAFGARKRPYAAAGLRGRA